MNFDQLYYRDPYRDAFDAKVLSCVPCEKGYSVILDRTCFYPEGGGENADRGTIRGAAVLDVRWEKGGNQIVHTVEKPLEPGSTVHGSVDFDYRFRMMQAHTGEHIVSGLAHRHFGCDNVGFHMGDEITTLDLNRPLTAEQIARIEREANEAVYADREVEILYPSDEELKAMDYRSKKELTGAVRIVRIPGADDCACCGLHVRRTGEIGIIKILSFIHYKKGVRIEMTAGRNAFAALNRIQKENDAVSHMLSAKPYETKDAVEKLLQESAEKDRRIAGIHEKYFRMRASAFQNAPLALCEEEGLNGIEIRKFCDLLVKEGAGNVCAVLCPENRSDQKESGSVSIRYCIGSRSVDLKSIAPDLNRALNGRGGGSPEMIQGTFHAAMAEVSSHLRELWERS